MINKDQNSDNEFHLLSVQIEAVLFVSGEPLSIKKIASVLENTEEKILAGISVLKQKLEDRGLKIIQFEDRFMLGTDPDLSQVVAKISKEEVERELSKASLETLSIILYKGPISKKEIDYIRGVNSGYILRNLLIKGLIEKDNSESKKSNYNYKISFDLLNYLGLKNIEEMPEYSNIQEEIKKLMVENKEIEQEKTIEQ